MTDQILQLALLLGEGEVAKLPGELEGGEDGVVAGEGDERGASQGAVLVHAGERVTQGILLGLADALLTPASVKQM